MNRMQQNNDRPREPFIVVGLTLLATVFAIAMVFQTKTNTQDWENWVEIDSKERLEFEKFKAMFGSNDYVIASWPGCTPDDPRLQTFSERLVEFDDGKLFDRSVNGNQAVEAMVSERHGFSKKIATRRLENVFFGSDLKTTCTAIKLSKLGSSQRRESIELIEEVANSIEGLGEERLRVGGNARVNVELDRQTNSAMLWSLPAILCSILIAWLAIGEIRLTLVALSIGGLAALFSMTLVIVSGHQVNGLLVLMPVLVQTVTLSSAIHLLGYYRVASRKLVERPEQQMIRDGWKPAAFAMTTSAIGVGSLGISRVPAVFQFGIFSAGSIMIGLILLCLVFPNALSLFSKPRDGNLPERRIESIGKIRIAMLTLAMHRPILVTATFVIFFLFAVLGLSRLQTNLDSTSLFSKQSRFAKDSAWFQQNVIPLQTIELVMSFGTPDEHELSFQLLELWRLDRELKKNPQIESTFSLARMTKLPKADNSGMSIGERSMFNDTLYDRRQELIDNDMLAVVEGVWYWRITISCGSETSDEIDFDEIIGWCDQTIKKMPFDLATPNQHMFTGMAPISWRGHQQLFKDLSRSFLLALCIITPMMIVLLRTIRGGLLAMIPNVFPPIVLFGMLGWIQYPVDVGMILTASVGLGIAVDNTFHFLHRFRVVADESGNSSVAVKRAFQHCSTPMLQTTVICCCGLAMFGFADFIPVRQFALAIVAILLLAALADLLLLPALAMLRKGKLFVR